RAPQAHRTAPQWRPLSAHGLRVRAVCAHDRATLRGSGRAAVWGEAPVPGGSFARSGSGVERTRRAQMPQLVGSETVTFVASMVNAPLLAPQEGAALPRRCSWTGS